MSDDGGFSRRDFLRGGFLSRRDARDPGPAPGRPRYTAVVAHDGDDIETERRRAREILGKIREPDAAPFDVLSLLAGLDGERSASRVEPGESDEEGRIVASIQPYACLAHLGTFCSVCRERCPEQGAIELVQGRPQINHSSCTGCGLCEETCPAPGGAIVISRV